MATGTDVTKIKLALIDPTLSSFGKTLLTLSGHTGIITAINFSYNDGLLVTGSRDNSAIIWGIDNTNKETYGKMIARLVGHTGFITDVCFSPDTSFVVTAGLVNHQPSSEWGAIIWKLDYKHGDYKAIKKLIHYNQVKAIKFSTDGKLLSTLCKDNKGFIWDFDLNSENFGNLIVKLIKGNNDWIRKYSIKSINSNNKFNKK